MYLLLAILSAYAVDMSVKVEPGFDIPLTPPQSEIYDIGGSESIKLEIPITPAFDIGPTASVQVLPAHKDGQEQGIAWGFGVGARLKVPHEADTDVSPWVDGDLLYAHTDSDLSRPSFDLGLGLAFPMDKAKSVWAGPFARYSHVMQDNKDNFNWDNTDARLLSVGISLEVGKRAVKEPECPACEPAPVPEPCPEDVVKQEQIHEMVYFAYDRAEITDIYASKLDKVISQISGTDYVVILKGHTDSDGSYMYNQDLSDRRADAVTQYLVNRGVDHSKIQAHGYSEGVSADTNATDSGRANNRRTEVVVYITTETGAE